MTIKPIPHHNHDDLDDHDKPVGRLLNRREVLALLGGVGVAVLGGCTLSDLFATTSPNVIPEAVSSETATTALTCVVKPQVTEGPYFVDQMLNRSDIRIEPSDGSIKEGTLLRLVMRIFDVSGGMCTPIKGAQVDVWHCDASGQYSGVSDGGFETVGEQWLRGYQLTDDMGGVQFTSIYPGWYSGRAVHIHFKVRTDPASETGYEFTSQLFFEEALNAKVYSQGVYADHGLANTPNATDSIFQQTSGLMTLAVTEDSDGGYTATMEIGMDLTDEAAGASDSAGGMGGPGGGQGGPGGQPPSGTPPQRP